MHKNNHKQTQTQALTQPKTQKHAQMCSHNHPKSRNIYILYYLPISTKIYRQFNKNTNIGMYFKILLD